jgi:sugar fermentation stimulation protein A
MEFGRQIISGKLVKRYKRFFADVILDNNEIVTAHCPNTGSMKTCGDTGDRVILTKNDDPKRKLKYTWEMTQLGETFVGVNTAMPNHIVKEALESQLIIELAQYRTIRPEVKYGKNSRIYFLLQEPGLPDCYVEVKNVTLAVGTQALFPDAVTSRGLKHLEELKQVFTEGHRAVMLFLVNRTDAEAFAPAWDIDPSYCTTLQKAIATGVEILVYRTRADLSGIWLDTPLPYSTTRD